MAMKLSNLIQANTLQIPLVDKSVQCIVTSPPYYGLRDYSEADQIGLEETLQEYIANLVAVFDECWRVLRDDGVVWLNMGDSYAGTTTGTDSNSSTLQGGKETQRQSLKRPDKLDLPAKNLLGIPWRVAFALQDRGWWLRSDIIWHKPNPMPESVTDRPTKSHEYIFLLTKNKQYYYDADAIREDYKSNDGSTSKVTGFRETPPNQGDHTGKEKQRTEFYKNAGRNKRTVWTITTRSYKGAHFATFPPELPEICIRAGTSEKGQCPECGKPWERNTKKVPTGEYQKMADGWDTGDGSHGTIHREGRERGKSGIPVTKNITTGWQPTCNCDLPTPGEKCIACIGECDCTGLEPLYDFTVPQIALDPFGGSGTTAMVARNLGRVGVSMDLSWEYLQLTRERLGMVALEEWENGKHVEANWADMPLFQENE